MRQNRINHPIEFASNAARIWGAHIVSKAAEIGGRKQRANAEVSEEKIAETERGSVIMLLSGNITNTKTASGVRSPAATENIVKIMDFPKPVGKTAKTLFPSRLYTAFSCLAFKMIVFPLKSKNNKIESYCV